MAHKVLHQRLQGCEFHSQQCLCFFMTNKDGWDRRAKVLVETGCQDRRKKLINVIRSRIRFGLSTWKRVLQLELMWEKILSWDQNLHIAVHQILSMLDWYRSKCQKPDTTRIPSSWNLSWIQYLRKHDLNSPLLSLKYIFFLDIKQGQFPQVPCIL